MALRFRDATEKDQDWIAEVFDQIHTGAEWFPFTINRAETLSWAKLILERCQVLVIAISDQAAGFLALHGDAIQSLFISPSFQNQGIGRRVILDLQSRFDSLQLWVFQDNKRAAQFYESAGFLKAASTTGRENEFGLEEVEYRWTRDEQ